ncbi:MAG TPA: cytochrome P450 [Polyangiales bacterium]|nr:cytochrome P450 [Polyangiales bacterium]
MNEVLSRADDPRWADIDMFDRSLALRNNPYPFLNRLREEHPVHKGPTGDYFLFRYADVVRLLRDTKVGVRTTDGKLPHVDETVWPRRFMLQQDPPNHGRLRRLVSKGFTPPAIERMRGEVSALVDQLLDRVSGNASFDLIADLARPLPSTVICQMLGVPLADRDLFIDWTAHVTHQLAPRGGTSQQVLERAFEAGLKLQDYFTQLIRERKQKLGNDLLSTLIRAEEAGDRLSPEELIVQAVGLLVAGFETTIGLIGNGVRQLLLHPTELAKLRERPELIGSAVEECLRFDGPIQGTRRVLHEDAQFGLDVIPIDTCVFVSISAAHRDPRVFSEPDAFRIERDHSAHLAFGGGPHFCLGAHLARLEAQIAIGSLFRRFPQLALETDEIRWGDSLFRVQASLPLRTKSV